MLPAKLTGHDLQYEGVIGSDVVQLRGTETAPARLDLGDGFFVGAMIQVRPSQNILWMNCAGEFQLPSAMLQQTPENESGGLKWVNAPHCRWLGELMFDGDTVVLSDGIDITASVLSQGDAMDLHLTGDRLQVELAGTVRLNKPRDLNDVSVDRITITETDDRPVEI